MARRRVPTAAGRRRPAGPGPGRPPAAPTAAVPGSPGGCGSPPPSSGTRLPGDRLLGRWLLQGQAAHVRGRDGAGEMVPLGEVAAELGEGGRLLGLLDAVGDR